MRLKRAARVKATRKVTLLAWLLPCLLAWAACGPSVPAPSETPANPAAPAAATQIFRLTPLRPIEELRREALAASPPQPAATASPPPELVEVSAFDDSIQLDIRYATDRNFMGTPFYESPRAYLRAPVAAALLEAHRELGDKGYGLLIYDAYRPWFVTKMFWEATPERFHDFVADPEQGSRHNRGAAVDLTLYDLGSGQPLPMPSSYDEFSERANPDYSGGTAEERSNRDLLIATMREAGFEVYRSEWWHFDFHGWEQYPLLNLTFEQLDQAPAGPTAESRD